MELVRQVYRVREFRGYALNFAARLETSQPHTILGLLQTTCLNRQVFFATAAEIDLDSPSVFLAQIAAHAPDVLADLGHFDPLAQIARALILMKPRRTLETLYGACPDGLLGLFERFGSQPVYGPDTYRLAFELFSRPENRQRAKVLGQIPGQIRPEHLMVIASLDDVLVHRAVLERVRRSEVAALNSLTRMIVETKRQYHAFVGAKIGREPPTEEGEREDTEGADVFYERCGAWLRENTRSAKKFAILFSENVTYGFRRNLLGLKPFALGLNLALIIGSGALLYFDGVWTEFDDQSRRLVIVIVLAIVHSAFMIFGVSAESVTEASRTYSRQLILSIEAIAGAPKTKRVAKSPS